MIELLLLGVFVGALSGFFGIGGGTILVPTLLFLGYDMKVAIGIAVMQMVFSSIYGSYLNMKKGTLDIKMVLSIGIGGFLGALLSSVIVQNAEPETLEVLFLGFVLFALARMFFSTNTSQESKSAHPLLLFLIGGVIGTFSISIGVGGSILLVPILVGFFHVPLKNAISAGLFFVIFSSLSGLISLSIYAEVDYYSGTVIGLASLVGVTLGIFFKHKSADILQRRLLLGFYIMVAAYLIYRLLGSTIHG